MKITELKQEYRFVEYTLKQIEKTLSSVMKPGFKALESELKAIRDEINSLIDSKKENPHYQAGKVALSQRFSDLKEAINQTFPGYQYSYIPDFLYEAQNYCEKSLSRADTNLFNRVIRETHQLIETPGNLSVQDKALVLLDYLNIEEKTQEHMAFILKGFAYVLVLCVVIGTFYALFLGEDINLEGLLSMAVADFLALAFAGLLRYHMVGMSREKAGQFHFFADSLSGLLEDVKNENEESPQIVEVAEGEEKTVVSEEVCDTLTVGQMV